MFTGLTPTKLVIAKDVISDDNVLLTNPDFELISIYPIQYVNISVFHHRKRHTLKAHFCNNNIRYFELGGNYYKVSSQHKKPKYLKVFTFSYELLSTMICSFDIMFWWRLISVYLVFPVLTAKPISLHVFTRGLLMKPFCEWIYNTERLKTMS